MKANRKFVKGEDAVSAVIGVILMVAITVAIAATVYVYVSGMLGTGTTAGPTVSMSQKSNYIYISSVQSGTINGSSSEVQVLTSAGALAAGVTGILNYGLGISEDNVDGGDTISFTGASVTTTYTVNLLNSAGKIVGTCDYTPTA